MEVKQCRMLVAKDYNEALKRCHVEDSIRWTQKDLDEQGLISKDLDRASLVSLSKPFDALRAIWLNDYQQTDNNEYNQARIEGSFIPEAKINSVIRLIKLHLLNRQSTVDIVFQKISFSYFDNNENLCAFTLIVLPQYPSMWFAAVTVNTEAPAHQRQLTLFAPPFSPSLLHNAPEYEELMPQISEFMELDSPLLINMNLLNAYLGYALNSDFIKYFLEPLFDIDGVIQIDNFTLLQESIKNQNSMLDFSNEIIMRAKHLCELNQLLAYCIKIRATTESHAIFNPLIDDINDALTHYSVDKYNAIVQKELVKSIGLVYEPAKSRMLNEMLHAGVLFPEKNYEFQNARLTILLASSDSKEKFKTKIKEFQQTIVDKYLDINPATNLKKTSLAKDLKVLGDFVINPSAENFTNHINRIKTNEKASKKREVSGHILTTTTIVTLAGLAGAVLFTPAPVFAIGLAAGGFFGLGGSSATLGYVSANERTKYKSTLQDIEKTLIANNPKEGIISKLQAILAENKSGSKTKTIQTIMSIFNKIKECKNNHEFCNVLADAIFSLKDMDKKTADTLREMREILMETQSNTENVSFDYKMIMSNITWAKTRLENIKLHIHMTKDSLPLEEQNINNKRQEEAQFVLDYSEGLIQPIADLLNRKTEDMKRDEILAKFLHNIKEKPHKAELIYHLDNAILDLFNNSPSTKIGIDLLALRDKLLTIREDITVNHNLQNF